MTADAQLKGGPNARQAAIAGGNLGFQAWLWREKRQPGAITTDGCRQAILAICTPPGHLPLTSRTQLDHVPDAAARWHDLWGEYQAWKQGA